MGGADLFCSPALRYFLYNDVTSSHFYTEIEESLKHYSALDDSDIISALKVWSECDDKVLSRLCADFIGRRLFRAEVFEGEVPEEVVAERRRKVAEALGIRPDEARNFVEVKRVAKEMYSATTEGIRLLYPDGGVHDVAAASHIVSADTPVATDCKHYLLSLRLDE